MRTHTHTHTRARTRARAHARTRAHAHTRTRAHAHTRTRTRICFNNRSWQEALVEREPIWSASAQNAYYQVDGQQFWAEGFRKEPGPSLMKVAYWQDGYQWEVPGLMHEFAEENIDGEPMEEEEEEEDDAAAPKPPPKSKAKTKSVAAKAKTKGKAAAKHPAAAKALAEIGQKRKLRPLQLWLLNKPKGVSKEARMEDFRRMTPEEKQRFADSTKQERGVA